MGKELSILIWLAEETDVQVFSRLLQQHAISFTANADPESLAAAAGDRGCLLLDEEILSGVIFEKIMKMLYRQPLWSDLPVVLLVKRDRARTAQTETLLTLIPNLTIVERPISSAALISVLQTALESRQRQYQVRDLLAALRRSNQELEKRIRQAAVAENTDVMLAYLDRNFNYTWVNQAYAEHSRKSPAALIGRNHFDLYPDMDNKAIFQEVRDTGKPVFYREKPAISPARPDNGTTYWDWSLAPVTDGGNQVESLVLSLRETTPFKEMQLQLAESEERFRNIAETSMDIIFQADLAGKVIYVSPAIKAMGYSPDELTGRPMNEFVAPVDISRAEAALEQVAKGGRIQFLELALLRADFSVMMSEINANPLIREGKIVGVQGMARDISERLLAAEKIRQVARFPGENPFPVMRIDRDGVILYANRSSKPLLASWERDTGEPLPAEVRRLVAATAAAGTSREFEQTCGDSILALTLVPIADGGFVNIYGFDITERKLVEERLRRSNEDLRHFASIVSHDLQEPLRTVSSFVQLIARKYGDRLDEKGGLFVQHIVDGTAHMQRLLNDLLSYSRISGGSLDRRSVSLADVVKDIKRKLDKTIKKNRAKITASGLPVVYGDEMQLFTLLQNLVSNALKYRGPEPPRIDISAERLGNNEWTVCVRDNGIGFQAKHAEQIFLIFQRLHLRTEYQGTGIGLAICKKIVERHGGRIWAESTPGEGAVFCFTLPGGRRQKTEDRGQKIERRMMKMKGGRMEGSGSDGVLV